MAAIAFPKQRPDQSPSEVWRLQNLLLHIVESLLGPREAKRICQPVFSGAVPHIVNTPDFTGVFAALTNNAAGYWPTTVYELAHETVHLLNPIAGCTNYLEEGVAVAFSVNMSEVLGGQRQTPTLESYQEAWRLVQELSKDVFPAAKAIRAQCRGLSQATVEDLNLLFPNRKIELLQKLVAQCVPR